jgi:uncharacterized protein YceK
MRLVFCLVLALSGCATVKVHTPDLLPDTSLECKNHQVWETNGIKHENCD